jgi:hypothetical protein
MEHLLHHMKSRRAQLPLQKKAPRVQHTLSQMLPIDEYWPKASRQLLCECGSMHAEW